MSFPQILLFVLSTLVLEPDLEKQKKMSEEQLCVQANMLDGKLGSSNYSHKRSGALNGGRNLGRFIN